MPASVSHRQLLVTTGVLPERDDDLERLPAWLDNTLAGEPTEHARLLRPFAHWFLLRRARRRAAVRHQPAIASGYLRTQITIALKLLAWLDQHSIALADLDQSSLDAWLAAGNTNSYNVRNFLIWAAARGIAPELSVPLRPRQQPEQLLDETERWNLLRRCLSEDTVRLDTHAAAALLLLFGLPISRIRHITIDQLDIDETSSFLRTGRHPLLLPPKLANLLKQLADTPHTAARISTKATDARWLFPGLTPGRPTSQLAFTHRLRDLGINAERLATPRSSPSPATCPSRSSPTSSDCTPRPPNGGRAWPNATGPPTSPSASSSAVRTMPHPLTRGLP